MIRFAQAVLAAVPLCLSPILFFATAEGWLNFGGGEKDLLLILPYLIWALVFFLTALILIIKHKPVHYWLYRAFTVALLVIIVLAVIAYVSSWLGVA